MPNFLAKELLKRFGFLWHVAPGEAEAECALLQREGIVDMVLSEDVDTLMFGCGKSLRNWSAEGARGNKSPTHVNVFDQEKLRNETGIDSDGMILVALMSGGDYIPAGVLGCGIKTACDAAKADFGKEMCGLTKDDTEGFQQWRRRLTEELRTNRQKFFSRRHANLTIPESFPDMTVLDYYKHPAVSSPEKIAKLRSDMKWDQEVDIPQLRMFVAEAFDWQYLKGARKLIRGLAPALLAHELVTRSRSTTNDQNPEAQVDDEGQLVKVVCSRRAHWNTDGVPELKIGYIPADIVGLDLDAEEKDDYQGAEIELSREEPILSGDDGGQDRSRSPTKRQGPSAYDPTEVEKIWVMETFVKLGVPLLVETWEEDMRNPKKFATRKAREKKAAEKVGMKSITQTASMDRYVKVTKPGLMKNVHSKASSDAPPTSVPSTPTKRKILASNRRPLGSKTKPTNPQPPNPTHKPPEPKKRTTHKTQPPPPASQPRTPPPSFPSPSLHNRTPTATSTSPPSNPWTLSRFRRPPSTYGFKPSTRCSALGIYASSDPENQVSPTAPLSPNAPKVRSPYPPSPTSPAVEKTVASPPVSSLVSPVVVGRQEQEQGQWQGQEHRREQEQQQEREQEQVRGQQIERGREGGRKLVALRESLEGAWKEVEEWECAGLGTRKGTGTGKGMFRRVEVLDLTEEVV